MRVSLLIAVFFATLVSACCADDLPVLVAPCNRAEHPPRLDGRLDDPVWQSAPLVSGLLQYGKQEPAGVQTAFRVLYDDAMLYVGVQCDEPLWQKVATGAPGMRDEHSAVFGGEAIEIFVDPGHDHALYYQIAANISGTVYDGQGSDTSWNSKTVARGAVSEGKWTLEVFIPWADLGVKSLPAGKVIGFNLCRDRNLGDREWTNWSQTSGGWHDPLHFGHLVLSPTPEVLGKLAAAFHKGGLAGPIRVYGAEGFSGTTYLALAAESIKSLEGTLGELEALAAKEEQPDVKRAITARIASARTEIAPVAQKVTAGRPLDATEWTRADLMIQRLKVEFDKAVWQARMDALLATI